MYIQGLVLSLGGFNRVLVLNEGKFVAEGTYEEMETADIDIVKHFFK